MARLERKECGEKWNTPVCMMYHRVLSGLYHTALPEVLWSIEPHDLLLTHSAGSNLNGSSRRVHGHVGPKATLQIRRNPGTGYRRFTLHTETDSKDRRAADRFPIERDVRYKVISKKSADEVGTGRTVNMSSNGILFTSDHMLLPGRRLELSVSWPAQLNNQTPLKLVARGRVTRFEGGQAAIEIQQYEFRTAPKLTN